MISSHLKSILLVVLALFAIEVSAQVFEMGRCPSPTAVPDFNINRYLGKWYNNRNYFLAYQANLDCMTAVYEKRGSGIRVTHKGSTSVRPIKLTVTGTGKLIAPGKIGFSFTLFPAKTPNYWVLGTDYTRYAVAWNCREMGPIRMSYAWILTRVANPPKGVIDDALAVFAKNGISTAPLQKTNHKWCPKR